MQNGKTEKPGKTTEPVSETVEKLVDQITSKGKSVLEDTFSEKYATLKRKASEWGLDEVEADVKAYVKKYPWKGVGIAAGIGFLIGCMFKSSGSGKD